MFSWTARVAMCDTERPILASRAPAIEGGTRHEVPDPSLSPGHTVEGTEDVAWKDLAAALADPPMEPLILRDAAQPGVTVDAGRRAFSPLVLPRPSFRRSSRPVVCAGPPAERRVVTTPEQ